jgi:hypothetical protein
MIKLSDLIDLDVQPSEKSRMKNFLNRGSRDQIDIHPNRFNVVGSKPGTIESTHHEDHPENTNSSQRYNNGYPWSFEDPSGIFEEEEENKIHQALIGREFQTLDDLGKMASRLRQSGFAQSEIEEFIQNYII